MEIQTLEKTEEFVLLSVEDKRAIVRGAFRDMPSRVVDHLRVDELDQLQSTGSLSPKTCERLCAKEATTQWFTFNGLETVPTFPTKLARNGNGTNPSKVVVDEIKTKPTDSNEVLSALEAFIQERSTGKIDEEKVRQIVDQAVKKATLPQEITIKIVTPTTQTSFTGEHYLFPLAVKAIASGVNLCVTGPTASGKTTMALRAAKALGQDVVLESFGPMSTKSDLVGYMDANGKYVPGKIYAPMKEGKMLVCDEYDACHPGVALILNSVIANRLFTFPNQETVEAHKDFRAVFCMNTLGLGATQEYVGRNKLDAATLDRLVTLHVPYDEAMEAGFAGVKVKQKDCSIEQGGTVTTTGWLAIVQSARKAAEKTKLPLIVSPRATLSGLRLAAQGIGVDWLKEMIILSRLTPEQRARFVAEWKEEA